jgi:hypothetical protein
VHRTCAVFLKVTPDAPDLHRTCTGLAPDLHRTCTGLAPDLFQDGRLISCFVVKVFCEGDKLCCLQRFQNERTANGEHRENGRTKSMIDFWQYLVYHSSYSSSYTAVVNINQDINSQKNNSFELNSPVKNDRRAIARTCPVHVGCVNDELKSSGTFGQTSNTT